ELSDKTIGYGSAAIVVMIWSSWMVVSRIGALSPLTVYDITTLRFGIAGTLSIPVLLIYKPWRTLSWTRIAVLTFLAGIPYQLLIYSGFEFAPAVHAGVYMNAFLPIFTLTIVFVLYRHLPKRIQIIGVVAILLGAFLNLTDVPATSPDAWKGDIMFVISAAMYSVFLVLVRKWDVTTPQILFCVMFMNGLIFVPVWVAVLPSAMAETSVSQLLLQGIVQGILATLIGLVLVAFAARKVGASIIAAFMSGVPAIAAVLAMIVIDEPIGIIGWVSILILTAGIGLVTVYEPKQQTKD
ncbi:MAG: DMT family transporter, partial [Methyloligellaceae bacterium]